MPTGQGSSDSRATRIGHIQRISAHYWKTQLGLGSSWTFCLIYSEIIVFAPRELYQRQPAIDVEL